MSKKTVFTYSPVQAFEENTKKVISGGDSGKGEKEPSERKPEPMGPKTPEMFKESGGDSPKKIQTPTEHLKERYFQFEDLRDLGNISKQEEIVNDTISFYSSGKSINELTPRQRTRVGFGIDMINSMYTRVGQAKEICAGLYKLTDEKLSDTKNKWIEKSKEGTYADRYVAGYVLGEIENVQTERRKKLADEKGRVAIEAFMRVLPDNGKMFGMKSIDEFKEEYNKHREKDLSLPEWGSYDFYVDLAYELRPYVEVKDDDFHWRDAAIGIDDYRVSEKRKYLDAYLSVLNVVGILGYDGLHYAKDGSINIAAGRKQAKTEDELYGVAYNALGWKASHLGIFEEAGLLNEDGKIAYAQYDAVRAPAEIAEDVHKAYQYYDKYKDKSYDDNFLGWVSGGWRQGDIGLKSGDAGKTLYDYKSADTEAADVYDLLSERIIKNSGSTFDKGNWIKNSTLDVARYAPQGIRQAVSYGTGYAVGAFFSVGNTKVASVVGNLFSSADMYGQTAGQAYLESLKSGLSVEDAHVMATNEAALSAGVEFLVGQAADLIAGPLAGKIFKTVVKGASPGKLVSVLMKAGMSRKGADAVMNASYKTAKFIFGNFGEGTEEFLQEGLSITAQRYAKEGRVVSATELLRGCFDFSEYTDEDFSRMKDSFKTGFVVGTFTTAVRSMGDSVTGQSKIEAAQRALKNTDAEYFGNAILGMKESDVLLQRAVVVGKESKNRGTSKLATDIDATLMLGESVSAEKAGRLTKRLLLEGQNVFAISRGELTREDEVYYQIEDSDGEISDVRKPLKDDGKSGKINSKNSKQSGVMWTMADGVLDNREVAAFYSKISEMKKQGYKNFNRTTDGEYIFEINNKLVVTDGKYMTPTITDVFTFESENETINAIAREAFYDQTQSGRTIRDAQSFIEIVYGEGFIKRNGIGDSGSYAQMHNGRRKGSSGTEIDSRSGKNVDAFDEVIAMGTNEHAEIARKKIAQAQGESADEVLNSIEDVSDSVGTTAQSVSLTPEQLKLKGKFEKRVGRMGYTVISAPNRSVPKGTIGYVDFKNREIYISPGHFSESLLTHELTHVIDRGYNGKYIKSLISFFKEKLSDEWNEEYARVKAKYEEIAEKNEGFTYTDSTLEAETLAELCSKFATDKYINMAESMEISTMKQLVVMYNYMCSKIKMLFGDESRAHKMKIASLKWQMALYRATKKGEYKKASGGLLFAGKKSDKWRPDLPKDKLERLIKVIKRDIKTSENSLTDTANWLYTNIGGTRVFAIYSTENTDNPTLLYESKDNRAKVEFETIQEIIKEINNGEYIDGKSTNVSWVLGSGWVRKDSSNKNDVGFVGRKSSDRDAGVLQGQSSGKSSAAFRSVVENLFEISSGRRGRGDGGNLNLSTDDDFLFSYVGEKAKIGKMRQLKKAKEMEAQGYKAEDIWQATRWGRGIEGKWRFEIDDSGAEFFLAEKIAEGNKGAYLFEVMKHDELYKAYPFLKRIYIILDDKMSQRGGYIHINLSGRELKYIKLKSKQSLENMKDTLLHEVQHAIQDYEGFESGASVDAWAGDSKYDNTEVGRARDRYYKAHEELAKCQDGMLYIIKADEYYRMKRDILNDHDESMKEIENFMEQENISDLFCEYIGAKNAYDCVILYKDAGPLKDYRNTPGEIEAREVSQRRNWDEEKRRLSFPESFRANPDGLSSKGLKRSGTEALSRGGITFEEIMEFKEKYDGFDELVKIGNEAGKVDNHSQGGIIESREFENYSDKIRWGIHEIEVRPHGKGFWGKRIAQNNTRVDAYELKINPKNESYYLPHPNGGYVQFENMFNSTLQDGKLIMHQKSFYNIDVMPDFAKYKVLEEAQRQIEAASAANYKVEWLVSDEYAANRLGKFFNDNSMDIIVRYYPE